jgi:hypothetical protein
MMTRTVTPTTGGWTRWRLLATLGAAATTALALLAGLVLAVGYALSPATAQQVPAIPGSPTPPVQGQAYRDQVAAAPMLTVPADAASTPEIATVVGPAMTVPVATTAGPAGVASGFPHTPEGAVAQLAAIEVTVVDAMSIPVTHQVYDAWAMPGGVGAANWAMTGHVSSFLTAAGDPGNAKDGSVLVSATPVAAQIKGSDGPDWVLGCVLLDVHATIVTDARIGYGHCERLQWTEDRWMIAPGAPPAAAPSTWPGSDLSIRAGWRTWTSG